MLGEKIKQLRLENNLTQKELADKVFVTAQAVSRWEKNEVEPSLATLTELAKIFDVQINEFFDENKTPDKQQPQQEKEIVYVQPKPVLAVCEQCNTPIYEVKDIVRDYNKVLCASCVAKNKATKHFKDTSYGIRQRKKSFILSGILSGIIFIALTIFLSIIEFNFSDILIAICVTIPAFTLISCMVLENSFIPDLVESVSEWGFVTFPGLIFELDLDGIIWFITVKLLFALLGYILSTLTLILALIVGSALSLFVYPFAIKKAFLHPELCGKFGD